MFSTFCFNEMWLSKGKLKHAEHVKTDLKGSMSRSATRQLCNLATAQHWWQVAWNWGHALGTLSIKGHQTLLQQSQIFTAVRLHPKLLYFWNLLPLVEGALRLIGSCHLKVLSSSKVSGPKKILLDISTSLYWFQHNDRSTLQHIKWLTNQDNAASQNHTGCGTIVSSDPDATATFEHFT